MPESTHQAELAKLARFLVAAGALVGLSYGVPSAADLRPWIPGEPVPLAHLVLRDAAVKETADGELVRVAVVPEAGVAQAAPPELAAPEAERSPLPPLTARPPAVPTPLIVPDGALNDLFAALAAAESGEPGRVVRVLHWGDSTIAGDGITRVVRARLQARFGDGGPGFLAVQVDPRWALRPGIARSADGAWESHTITFGGAESGRYGLAGTVSTATGEASSTLGGLKVGGERQPLHRFDVFDQVQPGGGTLSAKPRGASGFSVSTAADGTADAYRTLTSPAGSSTLYVSAAGDGPVTIYGVALETAGPGITWETMGVAGSSIGSLTRQSRGHLAQQVAHRDPDLLVYMTGGNEVGYPSLSAGEGEKYQDAYDKALTKLRAGAPDADCLIIGPLDQATRERGAVVTKPMLSRMIRLQREVAANQGCAFWDAQAAMGGDGGFGRFLDHEPRMAWTDLMHLTDEGLDLIGNGLADAINRAYDGWRLAHPSAAVALQAEDAADEPPEGGDDPEPGGLQE